MAKASGDSIAIDNIMASNSVMALVLNAE